MWDDSRPEIGNNFKLTHYRIGRMKDATLKALAAFVASEDPIPENDPGFTADEYAKARGVKISTATRRIVMARRSGQLERVGWRYSGKKDPLGRWERKATYLPTQKNKPK
jgi:hypothetical protein